MERGIEMFNTDKPINDTKSDLLNRASFENNLQALFFRIQIRIISQSAFAENGDPVKPQFSI